jgi:adenine phosphoribosyltransferase
MEFNYYKKLFSKNSIGRYDITPIFSDITVFESLINDLILPFKNKNIDKIIGIDAIGFVLGSAVSLKMKKGLILVRKENKIPLSEINILKRSFTDYTNKEKILEINKNLIDKNDNILIIDDWVETGEQVKAVISMVEELEATIIGISCIGFDRKEKTEDLYSKYNLRAIGINV